MQRTILITGAARRIGAGIGAHLAGAGHHVVLHYNRSREAAEDAARSWRATGGKVDLVAGDLAEPGAADEVMHAARAAAGATIDGLVNCASLFDFDRPPAVRLDLLDQSMRTNFTAPVALALAMARQPGLTDGAVVNLLDQKLANLNPDFFSYTCSKIALEGATTMLAQGLAPAVRVNAVSPGITLPSHDQSEAEFHAVASENLLRRPVAINDIARTVELLLTNGSITGQNIFVDCGQRFLTRDSDVMFATRSGVNG